MILPMFLFMCLFAVDLGQMVLMSGALQDSAFVSARKGAQSGAPGLHRSGNAYRGFEEALVGIPGADIDRVTNFEAAATSSGTSGAVSGSPVCTSSTPWVQVRVSYRQPLITPGLGSLIGLAGGPSNESWVLTQTAVARCEVVRS